jgi:hypothetical protein
MGLKIFTFEGSRVSCASKGPNAQSHFRHFHITMCLLLMLFKKKLLFLWEEAGIFKVCKNLTHTKGEVPFPFFPAMPEDTCFLICSSQQLSYEVSWPVLML